MQPLLNTAWWMYPLVFIDKILFVFYLISVCYLFIFAIGANINKRRIYPPARKQYRYIVLFFVGRKDNCVLESIRSFLAQDYPKELFDLLVVSNKDHKVVNQSLEQFDTVRLLITDIRYNKTDGIKYAMNTLPGDTYDVAIVMDADSSVSDDFIRKINDAYYLGGTAIQTHRLSRNLDSDTALFGAVSEEINNSIFRKGHVNLGFSSALIGSGMVFKYQWLKDNIVKITKDNLEKELERLLLEQSIFIEYLEHVSLYTEKATKVDEFYQQRNAWLTHRTQDIIMLLRKFPKALFMGNFNYCNKLLQWLLPSRTILIGTLILIAVFLLIISWGIAIKWWAILLMLVTSFSIAMPDHLIDARFIKALRSAPLLFLITVLNILKKKMKAH